MPFPSHTSIPRFFSPSAQLGTTLEPAPQLEGEGRHNTRAAASAKQPMPSTRGAWHVECVVLYLSEQRSCTGGDPPPPQPPPLCVGVTPLHPSPLGGTAKPGPCCHGTIQRDINLYGPVITYAPTQCAAVLSQHAMSEGACHPTHACTCTPTQAAHGISYCTHCNVLRVCIARHTARRVRFPASAAAHRSRRWGPG